MEELSARNLVSMRRNLNSVDCADDRQELERLSSLICATLYLPEMVSSPERRQRFGLFGFDSRISPRSGFFWHLHTTRRIELHSRKIP